MISIYKKYRLKVSNRLALLAALTLMITSLAGWTGHSVFKANTERTGMAAEAGQTADTQTDRDVAEQTASTRHKLHFSLLLFRKQ